MQSRNRAGKPFEMCGKCALRDYLQIRRNASIWNQYFQLLTSNLDRFKHKNFLLETERTARQTSCRCVTSILHNCLAYIRWTQIICFQTLYCVDIISGWRNRVRSISACNHPLHLLSCWELWHSNSWTTVDQESMETIEICTNPG